MPFEYRISTIARVKTISWKKSILPLACSSAISYICTRSWLIAYQSVSRSKRKTKHPINPNKTVNPVSVNFYLFYPFENPFRVRWSYWKPIVQSFDKAQASLSQMKAHKKSFIPRQHNLLSLLLQKGFFITYLESKQYLINPSIGTISLCLASISE